MHPPSSKAIRWVLVTTGIGTLPALVLLVAGLVEYQKPPNYELNPDPELSVTLPFALVLLSAVVAFAFASIVAVAHCALTRSTKEDDVA